MSHVVALLANNIVTLHNISKHKFMEMKSLVKRIFHSSCMLIFIPSMLNVQRTLILQRRDEAEEEEEEEAKNKN